ncbi:MAG TPA: glutamate-1-semialdehyde 2,1-aminomutase [Anaeromyxobacteraceae bacterium]|jgi:glutamate-1-semialdehyde 2,1-aminomutase|nr:glutamate-1-semialdehyde 2,1-aminomutase [Anaeromyxobacteraceae bacterium]
MRFDKSRELRERMHRAVPGGAHTYAKGDDQYPEDAPALIERGAGSHVWDVDGNEFVEYGAGLRSVTLGHGYPEVVEAAAQAMRQGINFVRPARIELEMAEKMLSLLPGAEMVKFAKNGSDVTTAAVKLARAHTGRDLVAVCGDQPFFSTDDWFIGTTAMDAGIPKAISDLTVKFRYNDLASLEQLFAAHPGRIACIVMEAATAVAPQDGYLPRAIEVCHAHGALFVLDEMITGFRWHLGGAQAHYGIRPDLSTFGKGIANGFALSALVGRREIMERGGLRHDKERVFLLSTTHGAETHALAAGLATIAAYQRHDVIGHLRRTGEALRDGIERAARQLGLERHFQVMGHPANLVYATRDPEGNPSQPFRTLFLQETVRRGLLMPSLVVNFSHGDEEVRRTVEGVGAALEVYRKALDQGVEKYLVGRPVKPVFRRFA